MNQQINKQIFIVIITRTTVIIIIMMMILMIMMIMRLIMILIIMIIRIIIIIRLTEPYLSGYSVRAGGKKLGNACCFEPSLRQAEGCTHTSAACADHNRIVCVVEDCVCLQSIDMCNAIMLLL